MKGEKNSVGKSCYESLSNSKSMKGSEELACGEARCYQVPKSSNMKITITDSKRCRHYGEVREIEDGQLKREKLMRHTSKSLNSL